MSKEDAVEKIAEWRWKENHPEGWVKGHPDDAWEALSKSLKRMLFVDAKRLLVLLESRGYVQLDEDQSLPTKEIWPDCFEKITDSKCPCINAGFKKVKRETE